jgi:hypothetical protein
MFQSMTLKMKDFVGFEGNQRGKFIASRTTGGSSFQYISYVSFVGDLKS